MSPAKEWMDKAARFNEHAVCLVNRFSNFPTPECGLCNKLATEFQKIAEERDERAAKIAKNHHAESCNKRNCFCDGQVHAQSIAAAIRAGEVGEEVGK